MRDKYFMLKKIFWLTVIFFLLTAAAQAGLDTDPCSVAGGKSNCQQAEMSFWTLWDMIQIRQALGKSVFEQLTFLHQRIALPFAPFFTTLLVAPLALIIGRRGTSVSTALSIGLVFLWYLIYSVFTPLGKIGALPPFWASWSQNILFALLGLGIWLWLNRGSLPSQTLFRKFFWY